MSGKDEVEEMEDDEKDTPSKDDQDLPDLDNESPAQTNDTSAAAQPAQAAPAAQPAPAPAAAPGQATSAAAATPAAQDNTIDVLGNRPPAQNAMQGFAQNMAFQQDLAGGKITPETYSSLYDKKSTLGKIGTMFGLMLSGAGSGLAHQPNMLMDMMNNEINRDLDAQKVNQANKQNWYNAALAHEKSLSEIAMNAATEQATRMGTLGAGFDAEMKNYNNSVVPGLQHLGATTDAKNNMSSAALQYMQDNVNRLAPGPSKTAGQAMIDSTVRPAVNAQIMKNQTDLAQRKASIHAIAPNPLKKAIAQTDNTPPLDPRAPAINNDLYQKGITLGRVAPRTPGAIPEGQVPAVNAEANYVTSNRNGYADWIDSSNKLNNLKTAGQVPAAKGLVSLLGLIPGAGAGAAAIGGETKEAFERQRNIEVEGLKQRLALTNKGMTEHEKDALANSILPAWNDTDETRAEAWRKGVQHFKTMESGTQNLDQYGLKSAFPELPYNPSKAAQAAQKKRTPEQEQQDFNAQLDNIAQ